jgi:class 3 adenylate cyclase/tetratricopeptide (TPR) repeat protein
MSGTAACPVCGALVGTGARFCAACGTQLGAALPEERKLATILFADVSGSTDLGERLDPERVRALLEDYFAAMSAIVRTWGGTVEKYIGDAIMAVWGVPVSREDDAVRALHAAHEMLVELERLNDRLEARYGVRVRSRIGVNTGEVIAPVGVLPGGQLIVSGDAVNIAARLEQATEPGTALVGDRTWTSARNAFAFSDSIQLSVKGKREPVTARTLGAPIVSSVQRTPFHGRMVGRERELATVVGLLDEAMESDSPRLVLISGPAGIGKSRMLRELISEAGARYDRLLVLRGRCLAAGHGITFWALGEILRAACSISLDEPAESAAAKLEQSVAGPLAAIGLAIDDIRRTAGALATSANLSLPDNPLQDMDPEAVFEEIGRAWPRLITGLARAWPLAVLIEDVHWADERMLGLVEMLAARSQGRVMLIATARPEFIESHQGFGAGQDLSVISLRALTGSQSGRLIDELIGAAALPAEIVDEIRAKAEGNPLFLEEMLQRLVDEGALVNEDGAWHATERAASVQLSDNVHSLLAARIDALPVAEKQFLQDAAVVGRIFWPGAVAPSEPAHRSYTESTEILRSLERRGLIAARPMSTIDNEAEYMFRHMLIHDVAYGSVPKARRARAHAEVARWIEQLATDRLDEFGELIAYHYSAALTAEDADLAWADRVAERDEIRQRGFDMLVRAGSSARHRFAIDKAVELHSDALSLASGHEELSRAHEELGDDHEALYRGDEAVAEYLSAIDSAQAVPDNSEHVGRLVAKAARMTISWGTFRDTPPIDRIQQLITDSLAGPVPDVVRAPLLIASAGLARGPNGSPIGTGRVLLTSDEMPDLDSRIAMIEQGLDIARGIDDPTLQFMAYDLLAIVFQASRQERRYRETVEQSLSLLERLPSRRQQVDLLVSVAGARADAGRYEDALAAAENAFARSADLSPHERMHAAWEVYRAAEPLGHWDRMLELLPWYAAAASAEGDITCAAVRAGPALGATVAVRRGQEEWANEIVPLGPDTGSSGTFGSIAIAARYAASVGRRAQAERICHYALEQTASGFLATGAAPMLDALLTLERFDDVVAFIPVAREQSHANELVPPATARAEGALAIRDGDRTRATARLREALYAYERLGIAFEIARTSEMLADLVEGEERDALLEKARDEFGAVGAAPSVARVKEKLASSGERLAR